MPILRQLIEVRARIVVCGGWIGRPGRKVVEELRMDPVARELERLLGQSVAKLDDCVGPSVEAAVAALKPGEIVLLENTRFHPEEEANDPIFADKLARLGEVCVYEAFAHAHRTHASTTGLVNRLPTRLGPAMERELAALDQLRSPARPFVVVLGGAKLTDKIQLVRSLGNRADNILVGGALANLFLKAQGIAVGSSRVESADIDGTGADPMAIASQVLKDAGDRLILPVDLVAGDQLERPTVTHTINLETETIDPSFGFYDIGPTTSRRYAQILAGAGTIFWNGLMGVCEDRAYEAGTRAIGTAIVSNTGALTIAGGGDTEAAIDQFGWVGQLSHVSTGGGAALRYVCDGTLPVLGAIEGSA